MKAFTKKSVVLALMTLTIGSFANAGPGEIGSAVSTVPSIEAKILPQAKVTDVNCYSLTNQGHDWASSGSIEVVTEQGKTLSMDMIVSRLGDQEIEADRLCKTMKAIKKSGKKTDLIFTEEMVYDYRNWDGAIRFEIKGAADLSGFSPSQY